MKETIYVVMYFLFLMVAILSLLTLYIEKRKKKIFSSYYIQFILNVKDYLDKQIEQAKKNTAEYFYLKGIKEGIEALMKFYEEFEE